MLTLAKIITNKSTVTVLLKTSSVRVTNWVRNLFLLRLEPLFLGSGVKGNFHAPPKVKQRWGIDAPADCDFPDNPGELF